MDFPKQVIAGCEYRRDVLGKVNPKTGEPCVPPVRIHILCDEGRVGEAKALIASINASRGWLGKTYEIPLFTEKRKDG